MKHKANYAKLVLAAVAIIATASVGASAIADTAASPAKSEMRVAATISPNPPRAGDNTLDLQVTASAGQPMSGLKLSARVEMTSMDMGTSHPAVKDMGSGHYRATVTFSMAGPWRVTLSTGNSKAMLNVDVGNKTRWKAPSLTLSSTGTGASTAPVKDMGTSSPSVNGMPGMDMAAKPSSNTVATASSPQSGDASGPGFGPNGPPVSAPEDNMAGMDMSGGGMGEMKMGSNADASMDMKPLKMPQLQEQGSYVATGHENWKVRTGFGKNTGMIAMMSKMMVGGSGMEGMKMPAMKMSFNEQNFTEDPDDANTNNSSTTDGNMPGMDMGIKGTRKADGASAQPTAEGTATSPVNAQSSPTNAMPGMTMPRAGTSPSSNTPLKITGTITSPKSGDNILSIVVTDASGSLITGAKITPSVAMTSMDMGTTHPPVKEIGSGKYQSTTTFSMSGPWRVIVKVVPPGGGEPQKKTFDFNAK